LEYYLKILKVSDAIIKPDQINLEERANFTTDEILELLLEKLYVLYDDYYHSVIAILDGNGIELKRHGEERDLVNALESYGYVSLRPGREISAQLTLDGKIKVEEMRRAQPTDYSKINKTQDELLAQIVEIKDGLTELKHGQEVIFNELDDLGELYSKLSKKNWGEILKGKLIDLALAEVINKETMNAIFKELTDQVLRLK